MSEHGQEPCQGATLADLGARFMAAFTMMRVDKISCSSRGRMPGRASGGAYATPFGAMMSLAQPQGKRPCVWEEGGWHHDTWWS